MLTVDQISSEVISGLANKEILAVRIPNYCDETTCRHVAGNLSGMQGVGYEVEPNFKKMIGGALFDAADEPSLLDKYFDLTPSWYRDMRQAFFPYAAPSDQLRLQLDEVWPAGSSIARVRGKVAFSGLLRGIGLGGEAAPHQDMTNWDLPDDEHALDINTQLSCLTYFACADVGGELELWSREIESREEYNSYRTPGSYGLERGHIGEPDAVLTPRVGELIIFNARCIHAVRRVDRGSRYSQSFFIGFRSDREALSIFS